LVRDEKVSKRKRHKERKENYVTSERSIKINNVKVGENASTTHTDRDNETVGARNRKKKIPRKNISKG